MLARRLPSILPPLSRAEAVEVTRIHSVAGRRRGAGLMAERPFRAPHHMISASGLVGGGAVPVPGEASLAHHGVLFLDELSEFPRPALEALRQPLEDGRVAIVRGQRTAIFPTRFLLVAATNPCPCGHAPSRRCRCSEGDLARYARRLSGPLLDRIDLLVHVQRPDAERLAQEPTASSETERARVTAARERQLERLDGTGVDVQRPHGRAAAAPPRAACPRTSSARSSTPTAAASSAPAAAIARCAWRGRSPTSRPATRFSASTWWRRSAIARR